MKDLLQQEKSNRREAAAFHTAYVRAGGRKETIVCDYVKPFPASESSMHLSDLMYSFIYVCFMHLLTLPCLTIKY